MSKLIFSPIQCFQLSGDRLPAPAFGLFITLVFFSLSYKASAQEETGIKEIVSAITGVFTEDDDDLSELTERLSFYSQHPLDLNSASRDQLKELFLLSPLQISSFFTWLRKNGKLKDILELQSVDGFDSLTITRLLPFVIVREVNNYDLNKLTKGASELLLRYGSLLEKQKGFKEKSGSRYLGSPARLLFKYKYNYNDLLTLSIIAEKDPGETFFREPVKSGFDFISGSLARYKTGRFKKIIIGDYSLQFGQGLSLWSGSSFGKGDDVAGVAKKDTGLKPYASANEYSFFRGAGVTYTILKNIELTSFISIRNLDAALKQTTEGTYTLSAISTNGLHRTVAENRNKGTLPLLFYGAALTYNNNNLDIGLTTSFSDYQHEFITGSQLYKKYSFKGSELNNLGIHYNYTFKNIYFFGETALSRPGGTATLNGAMASLSPVVSLVVLYRSYAKEHVSFYNKGFGEGANTANEQGLYGGIHIRPSKKWTITASGDFFRFPWAKYRVDDISSGYELTGSLNSKPNPAFLVTLSLKTKHYEQNEGTSLPVNPLVKVRKDNYRIEARWKLNKKTELQTRTEISRYGKGKRTIEYGYMVYQDVDYHPLSSRFSTNLRIAFFSTASADSRIYAYEDDVLHGTGSGVYSGEGIRTFLNVSYRFSRQLRAWCRYAVYHYPGKTSIGTGLDEISGNSKSELKIQLRYQF